MSSVKREIRHFHVVVVQKGAKKCTKMRDHVQSCCLPIKTTYCFFDVLVAVRVVGPVFRPKRRKNPTRWGGTYLYSLYKGVPPGLNLKPKFEGFTSIIKFIIHCSHHLSSHWLKAYS